tara:strand:- start:841 stop:1053 length:213 start_codon:yes stop_codon:yes gene_type:complete
MNDPLINEMARQFRMMDDARKDKAREAFRELLETWQGWADMDMIQWLGKQADPMGELIATRLRALKETTS